MIKRLYFHSNDICESDVIHNFDSELELSDAELHLYSRQILLDGWDIDAQERLKLSNILIIGCGGIGCTTAELLARAGVGQITLIDADTIEMSNLQRQMAYIPSDIGFYKAEVLAKRLRQINPHITVNYQVEKISLSNAEKLIANQDVVLDGCDNFATRYLVNQFCKKLNTPLISASAVGFTGQLLMVEGDSACYECLFSQNSNINQQDNDELRCTETGVLATTPNVIASLQAHHTLLYLGLGLTPLKQKILVWEGLSMKQRILAFEKDTECLICLARQSANGI